MITAITGGIGSGKSYVCRLLEQRGVKIYDCDKAAKRLIREDENIRQSLTELIGPETYDGAGRLNKAAVAAFILASQDNTLKVNAIVHPAVARDFQGSGYEWMECAILYESGFDRLVDRVVTISAPRELRIERIMRRDGLSRPKAEEWIDMQLPQEEVERQADIVIVNDGGEDLEKQISRLIGEK